MGLFNITLPENIHVHVYMVDSQTAKQISESLLLINQKLDKMATTLADLQSEVTAEDTVIDSAVTLIQGLAAQVAALAPNQAAIDALAADIKAKSDGLAAAVAAGTPAAPGA